MRRCSARHWYSSSPTWWSADPRAARCPHSCVSLQACRWRYPDWCSAWPTSCSSTSHPIRWSSCTGPLAYSLLNSITHFYTVCHLAATAAIRQLDREFEAASVSLKVPVWRTFLRVTVPICLPAILEIAIYIFVNAMTTVSAVIFLYGPDTKPASVAVVHMDEAGQASAAAAMAVTILAATTLAKIAQIGASSVVSRLTQSWRRR